MSLIIIPKVMELIEKAEGKMEQKDKEFVAKYAFQTGDMELVKKLIEELGEPGKDKEQTKKRFMQLADSKPGWAETIENLVIALEMYRIEEEKAIGKIKDFLLAKGVDITADSIKESKISDIKDMVKGANSQTEYSFAGENLVR